MCVKHINSKINVYAYVHIHTYLNRYIYILCTFIYCKNLVSCHSCAEFLASQSGL